MLRSTCIGMALLLAASTAMAQTQGPDSDQVPTGFLKTVKMTTDLPLAAAGGGKLGRVTNGSLLGVDSVDNFSSFFYNPGLDSNGFPQFTWQYTMMGKSPFSNRGRDGRGRDGRDDNDPGITLIGAPIVPVNVDLRNADGSPKFSAQGKRLVLDATQFVAPVLKSPVFFPTSFSSSDFPTQFADAVQRAAFFTQTERDWHTIFRPRVLPARTLVLLPPSYRFAVDGAGNLLFVLVDANTFVNALFPATPTDTTSIMGAVENAGQIKTSDFSTFLFPNTFLFANGDPNDCCILGFHSYDIEPGDKDNGFRERRYVMNYSSWIPSGLFSGAISDITALSHEFMEAVNDPFVNNATPWWLGPAPGPCMNVLESGDVLEELPDPTFPIAMNGMTYHPQNVALLPWFAGVKKSPAIFGAFSYPDTTILTQAATFQQPGCGGGH